MGNPATPESLIARWHEVLVDPSLKDLPYKIELNAWGKVEMSPASNRHGRLQAELAAELKRQLPRGTVITECSVLTRIGIRVPDVVWASSMQAPDICVEIVSPSNVQAEIEEKKAAYLRAGAREVWIISEQGAIRFFGAGGEKPASNLAAPITLPEPADKQ